MEFLVVHLPHKALIRGPVHYKWMYPYERSMKHLKGKAKNLANVEGSIVTVTSIVLLCTKNMYPEKSSKKIGWWVTPTYAVNGVQDIFCPIGSSAGN